MYRVRTVVAIFTVCMTVAVASTSLGARFISPKEPQGVAGKITNHAGQAIDLIVPPRGFLLLEPQSPPPKGGPFPYANTGPGANWNIASWDIPGGKLPPFTRRQSGGTVTWESSAAAASVRIDAVENGTTVLMLSQNGAALPCTTNRGTPRESDLFAGPNDGRFAPPALSGTPALQKRVPLSDLSQLLVRAQVKIVAHDVPSPKGCEVSQGGALISVVLSNPSRKQTLFYKVKLNNICGPQSIGRSRWCHKFNQRPVSRFYFSRNPFGVDDFLPLSGRAWVAEKQWHDIELDLLPRILTSVQAGPPELDRDLSHWMVSSFYVGQHIWGDVSLTSSWRNMMLTAVVR